MKRHVLFICESREDAKNLIPIVTEGFPETGLQYKPLFISLDKFYNQNTETEFKKADVPFMTLPRLDKDTALLSSKGVFARLKIILIHSAEIQELVSKSDAVVCCSPGSLRKTFAALARKLHKPAYCVQVGLVLNLARCPISIIKQKLYRFATGSIASTAAMLGVHSLGGRARGLLYENFTRVFVMGEDSRQVLIGMGHKPEQIVVSGVPRFKQLFTLDSKSREMDGSSNATGVLYLTGAYLWHRDKRGHQKQQRQLKELCHAAEEHNWPVLKIRIHPRENPSHYGWVNAFKKVVLLQPDQDIYQHITGARLVVAMLSTAVWEAIMLGRIGLFLEAPRLINMPEVWRDPKLLMSNMAQTVGFINRCFVDKHFADFVKQEQRRLAEYVISPRTPDAAKLIARYIASDVEKGVF